MKVGLFCLLFVSSTCLGQLPTATKNEKTSLFAVGTSVNYHPLDFFHGIEISRKTRSFTPTFTFAYGLKTTLFQARFFPSLQLYIPYQFSFISKRNNRLYLGLGPNFNYLFLKLNKSSNHSQFWQEYLLSYRFEYGEKWRISQQSGFGVRSERYYSTFTNEFRHAVTPSYSFSIGLIYCL